MLKNAQYIMDNIIIADEKNTTKKYCRCAQVGADVSLKDVMTIKNAGKVYKDKTLAPDYESLPTFKDEEGREMFFIPQGTYIIMLNEGCNFGMHDTGYIVLRSSLNRGGTGLTSAIWDPSYKSSNNNGEVLPMSVRITVETEKGIYIEKNARVGQLIVFENEDTTAYQGQWQGGLIKSNLE